jgi:hypothetical protein
MTIEAAGIPGICSIWADPLYEGPVPGGLTDSELIDARMRYLAGAADVRPADEIAIQMPVDRGNDMRQWRAAIERHDAYDELILWFEHDLFDQLNLIQVLTWIDDHLPAAKPVSLICIGSFPGRPDFKGLGELTPEELAPLLDMRQPVSGSQYEMARRAWQAFREPTPEALDELRQGNSAALPYLPAALTRFLQEYPWTRDGLSRTERRLLDLTNDGGIALSKAFPRMHEGEEAYHVTDASLLGIAETLSRTSPPLLTFRRPHEANDSVLEGVAAATDAGRSVSAGQLDRVDLCGGDRWLGGVHVQGRGPIWRWDDARGAVRYM